MRAGWMQARALTWSRCVWDGTQALWLSHACGHWACQVTSGCQVLPCLEGVEQLLEDSISGAPAQSPGGGGAAIIDDPNGLVMTVLGECRHQAAKSVLMSLCPRNSVLD